MADSVEINIPACFNWSKINVSFSEIIKNKLKNEKYILQLSICIALQIAST